MELRMSEAGEWFYNLKVGEMGYILYRIGDILDEDEFIVTGANIYFKNKEIAVLFKLAFDK